MAVVSTPKRETTGVQIDLPHPDELWNSLDDDFKEAADKDDLVDEYQTEKEIIFDEMKRIDNGYAGMTLFRCTGKQAMAQFSAKDLSKDYDKDQQGFHGNTSQWSYAGGIVIDLPKGRVTRHH